MDNHTCKKCKIIFATKSSLERHINKKIKCDIKTNYKCNKCNKYFKQKNNLLQHTEKGICKNIQIEIPVNNTSKNEKAILDIIESKITIDKKIIMLKLINSTLIDMNIIEILNNDLSIETKITLLNSKTVQTINNTTNNTTNNIQFNNFGNENIDYFHEDYLKKLINTVSSAKCIGGESLFLKLTNEIYLNEQHPENQTIKIDNLNNKFCKVKKNNKWITADKNESLKKIFNRACEIVSICIMENKDMYKEAQLETINGYIEKDFEDEIIIETVKKFALDIYNFYNSTV
jgi:hypothetical protein